MPDAKDRPRFAISADRHSASRRVRYVETSHPDDGNCTLCKLTEEAEAAFPETPAMTDASRDNSSDNSRDDDESFSEAALREAIENQIAADNPPATRATLNKLVLVGYERDDAVRLMALILAYEIENMLASNRSFDVDGYERMLRALPDLPEGMQDDDEYDNDTTH